MQNAFSKWLSTLDQTLKNESDVAGTFKHNQTAGGIREVNVQELLKRILPPAVMVASGKVIDSFGGMSKQIDIILFDVRFPCLRLPYGPGLFPVEGVLATIEVRTRIDSKKHLKSAIENCRSVLSLKPVGHANMAVAMRNKFDFIMKDRNASARDANIEVGFLAATPTYIFAVNEGLTAATIYECIGEWLGNAKIKKKDWLPLPRVILAGDTLGLLFDGIQSFTIDERVSQKARETFGLNAMPLMAIYGGVPRRLSAFVTHLLLTISRRIGTQHFGLGGNLSILSYLPAMGSITESDGKVEMYVVHGNGEFPDFSSTMQVPAPHLRQNFTLTPLPPGGASPIDDE